MDLSYKNFPNMSASEIFTAWNEDNREQTINDLINELLKEITCATEDPQAKEGPLVVNTENYKTILKNIKETRAAYEQEKNNDNFPIFLSMLSLQIKGIGHAEINQIHQYLIEGLIYSDPGIANEYLYKILKNNEWQVNSLYEPQFKKFICRILQNSNPEIIRGLEAYHLYFYMLDKDLLIQRYTRGHICSSMQDWIGHGFQVMPLLKHLIQEKKDHDEEKIEEIRTLYLDANFMAKKKLNHYHFSLDKHSLMSDIINSHHKKLTSLFVSSLQFSNLKITPIRLKDFMTAKLYIAKLNQSATVLNKSEIVQMYKFIVEVCRAPRNLDLSMLVDGIVGLNEICSLFFFVELCRVSRHYIHDENKYFSDFLYWVLLKCLHDNISFRSLIQHAQDVPGTGITHDDINFLCKAVVDTAKHNEHKTLISIYRLLGADTLMGALNHLDFSDNDQNSAFMKVLYEDKEMQLLRAVMRKLNLTRHDLNQQDVIENTWESFGQFGLFYFRTIADNPHSDIKTSECTIS